MTELLNQEESTDRKLEGEELANAARELRDQLNIHHGQEVLEDFKLYIESGGLKRLIIGSVDGEQQRRHVDAGKGEYVQILVAIGPSGINSVRYFNHGMGLTDLEDSERAVREAQDLLAKIFPKSKG